MSARGLIVGSEHVVMQVVANHPSDHSVQSILAHAQVPRFQAGVVKPDKFRDELDKSEEGTKSPRSQNSDWCPRWRIWRRGPPGPLSGMQMRAQPSCRLHQAEEVHEARLDIMSVVEQPSTVMLH